MYTLLKIEINFADLNKYLQYLPKFILKISILHKLIQNCTFTFVEKVTTPQIDNQTISLCYFLWHKSYQNHWIYNMKIYPIIMYVVPRYKKTLNPFLGHKLWTLKTIFILPAVKTTIFHVFYLFWAEDWEIIKKKLGLILEDLYKMMFFLVLPENQLPIRFLTVSL